MYKFKLTNLNKQLKEQELQSQEQKYKIFCDMDGVLTDFDSRFKGINPEKLSPTQYTNKYDVSKFWDTITKEGKEFWEGMQWMPDGKQLWEYISKYNPKLLSAPSRDPSSRLGKRLWVKNNIPDAELILASADKKQNYSKTNTILIDDRPDNVSQWRNKGGIGILHTNTQDTIKQLQNLGL
jgi:FMN phosphatase YigB (HAD superfamily)